jgi:hypothetical protein
MVRRFFKNWRASLKWQRLKPYGKFADMIDRHWDGIAAYCRLENKVSLSFVEGLKNKIRVIQRRAYGLRDEEYLRLKVLTGMLPRSKKLSFPNSSFVALAKRYQEQHSPQTPQRPSAASLWT